MAARIFGVDEPAVDESMRRVAKTVNFGVIYGLSPFGLASRLGITQAEAAAFIDAYFQEYAGVDRFITQTLEAAHGYGPRRDDPGPPPADHRDQVDDRPRAQPGRAHGHQHRHPGLGRRPDQAGHDPARPEACASRASRPGCCSRSTTSWSSRRPLTRSPRLAELVRREMTAALDLKVPLKVDMAAGPNWLDVEEIVPSPVA